MAADDLDFLDPAGRNVTVAGQSITVRPLTIGQLPRFARAMQPAAPLLAGDQDPDWLTLIADHGEALIEGAAVATEMRAEEIEAMAPDEFACLCGAIFEVNVDFFVQRLAPALERVSDRVVAATERIGNGAGEIRSRSS